ncbi:hypothetical protein T459_26319 [Capsicum annuum]|uniref:Uncharacterized protein n=1 Tax=Capsicum annuum TaxID=4072 RepID=A0A2G2YNE6_CAPAN|nr:hypothetical protein T459_26319 [Capsicum annuum]
MNKKRAKDLCFFFDEKYVQGHNCRSNKQLYMVEVEEVEEGDMELAKVQESVPIVTSEAYEFMAISLQALTGVTGYQTLRVTGYHEKRPLQVLIDTRSTPNFIDQEVGTKLQCKASPIHEQSISVADGRKVQTASICKDLTWLLQGTTFSSDFLILLLGNVDIVLEVQ